MHGMQPRSLRGEAARAPPRILCQACCPSKVLGFPVTGPLSGFFQRKLVPHSNAEPDRDRFLGETDHFGGSKESQKGTCLRVLCSWALCSVFEQPVGLAVVCSATSSLSFH